MDAKALAAKGKFDGRCRSIGYDFMGWGYFWD
jgi:hypothetical protein